jgi:hypothetical protein
LEEAKKAKEGTPDTPKEESKEETKEEAKAEESKEEKPQMMTTDDEPKKDDDDAKSNKSEKKVDTDTLTEEEKETIEKEADKKYDAELASIFNKIVEKAQFLVKMQVPFAYLVNKEKKSGGTLIFIKE